MSEFAENTAEFRSDFAANTRFVTWLVLGSGLFYLNYVRYPAVRGVDYGPAWETFCAGLVHAPMFGLNFLISFGRSMFTDTVTIEPYAGAGPGLYALGFLIGQVLFVTIIVYIKRRRH